MLIVFRFCGKLRKKGSEQKVKALAFGEILFDCYPAAQKIGGAPFNFCAHLAQLGGDAFLYSAVGRDELGENALSEAGKRGVHTHYLETHSHLPTGVCKVTYQGNEPAYDLAGYCAYDEIPMLYDVCSEPFDLFYFGTLASRSESSRKTLETLLSVGNFETVFFDMNLRQQYYSEELVTQGLLASNIVKMNREEFSYVKQLALIDEPDYEAALKAIGTAYGLKTAILTLDKDGAMVWDKKQGFFQIPAKESEMVSAVGAGDSFCACFLYHLFRGASIPQALEKAGILSAFVISREEAIPTYPHWLKEQLK